MEIGPLNRVGMNVLVSAAPNSQNDAAADSQIVTAVQHLNKSELLGRDRALTYRRDAKTGRLVIQIIERQSGDVVDQIPPEVLLRLYDEYTQSLKVKEPQE